MEALLQPTAPYEIESAKSAPFRVLCAGCCAPGAADSKSAVGKFGHLERASAWTHLIPCIVFILAAILRLVLLPVNSTRAVLSGVSIAAVGLTFGASTMYHIYSAVPGYAHWTRTLDHSAIAVSMSLATVADLAVVTLDFAGVPLQTLLDPLLAMAVIVGFFISRRFFVPANETKENQFGDEKSQSLGLARVYHSDLEHSGLRSATTSTLLLAWVLAIPSAFSNLSVPLATIWVVGATSATALVVIGFVVSNFSPMEELLKRGICGDSCAFKRLGCFLESHSLWHVVAALSASLAVVTREVVIGQI